VILPSFEVPIGGWMMQPSARRRAIVPTTIHRTHSVVGHDRLEEAGNGGTLSAVEAGRQNSQ